jgi:hypothetical protein
MSDSIEIPYSIFRESVERMNRLAYCPSESLETFVPASVFRDTIEFSRKKAYNLSENLSKNQ